jgi:hypothetical protein
MAEPPIDPSRTRPEKLSQGTSSGRLLLLALVAAVAVGTGGCKLAWAPPMLENPLPIDVPANGIQVTVPGNWDCKVRMPSVTVTDTVRISGCRNIVLIGGRVSFPGPPDGLPEEPAINLTNYTDTAHVEGVELGGAGLSNGLWLSTKYPNTTAQVENVFVHGVHAKVEPADGPWPEEHPDLIQLWQGPSVLRVDRFTGTTDYQGIVPDTAAWSSPRNTARLVDIRNTNVHLTATGQSCFAVFQTPLFAQSMTSLTNAFCDPGARPWNAAMVPNPSTDPEWWGDVQRTPAGAPRDFVDSNEVGIGYEPPGYEP